MTTKEIVNRGTGEIIEAEPVPLAVSLAYVQETIKSIALLQDMTRNLLKRGRDFGRTPGTATDGLWDPGASLIIAGFNCYAGQRRILSLVDEEDKISIIVEVPIISRQSGKEVGTGIGAASTLETKYKYRWLYPSELKEIGYTEEQIATLKVDKRRHPGKHRLENLERGELLNTLIKQGSKRAEVDAAEALPGVASVLREMFDPHKQDGVGDQEGKGEYDSPVWQRFWGEVRRLGMTDQEAHAKLGVTSMKEWLGKGYSLEQALDIFMGRQTRPSSKTEPTGAPFPTDVTTDLAGADGVGFNMEWLNESLKTIKWPEATVRSFLKNTYQVDSTGTLEDILRRMNQQQKETFAKEVQNRLDMV